MSNSTFAGPEVNLFEMLDAREMRRNTQLDILQIATDTALLSATMNIPGPVKRSDELAEIFKDMQLAIEEALADTPPSANLYRDEKTGLEYFALTTLTPQELKRRMVQLEENHPFGRLVDLDVLWLADDELNSISREDLGLPQRRCLICEKSAKDCGRNRTHSVEDMQAKIVDIIEKGRMHKND